MSPFVLDSVTFVPALIAALEVISFCAVTATSPCSDSAALLIATLPAAASMATFWSAFAAPRRVMSPLVTSRVIVPPSVVAVNVLTASVTISPFSVLISISLPVMSLLILMSPAVNAFTLTFLPAVNIPLLVISSILLVILISPAWLVTLFVTVTPPLPVSMVTLSWASTAPVTVTLPLPVFRDAEPPASNSPLLVMCPVVVFREIFWSASTASTLILPVSVLMLTLPDAARNVTASAV